MTRYCFVEITPQEMGYLLEHLDGFGTDWVTGWAGSYRCVWCNDCMTALKVQLLTDGRMVNRDEV